MSLIQISAVIIFVIMFVLIVSEKIQRHTATMLCGAAMLIIVIGLMMKSPAGILEILSFNDFITPSFWYTAGTIAEESKGVNWATIVFIAGMMIMVEGMGHAGFFRWLCLRIAKAVNYKPTRILITFMIMSGVLAMFIDSITVILFLAAITVELSQLLKFDPVPLIIAEVFCANLGGSSTMCGDPPNIIIGTALNYTFTDFITNIGPFAGIAFIFILIYFYLCFHKELKEDESKLVISELDIPEPRTAIKDKKSFSISSLIFLVTVVLLVTHAQTGLTVATIGVGVGIVTLLTSGSMAKEIIKKLDYQTLLFFTGLFIVVGGLEETKVLELIAQFISNMSGSNLKLTVAIVMWISAIASAFVDNIPFSATMVPVIKTLSATQGFDLSVLAYTLSMGTDIGGSMTPIGASANVVGISVAAQHGHLISWGRYCKYSVPATLIVITMFMLMTFVRYC